MIGEETKGVDNRENNRNWRSVGYTEYNQLNVVHAGLCGVTTLHRLRFSANSHLCYFSFPRPFSTPWILTLPVFNCLLGNALADPREKHQEVSSI